MEFIKKEDWFRFFFEKEGEFVLERLDIILCYFEIFNYWMMVKGYSI